MFYRIAGVNNCYVGAERVWSNGSYEWSDGMPVSPIPNLEDKKKYENKTWIRFKSDGNFTLLTGNGGTKRRFVCQYDLQ